MSKMSTNSVNAGRYWSDIRQIIERHFEYKDSKYLCGGRKNTSMREYYYNSDVFKPAESMYKIIEDGSFSIAPGIERVSFELDFPKKRATVGRPCMLMMKETENIYEIEFWNITGFEAIKSYGQKTALKVTTSKQPLLQLVLSKQYGSVMQKMRYGNPSSFRFSWWTNRLLRENDGFFCFFTDIVERLGQTKPIFNDILRCLRKHRYCLLNASFEQIEKKDNIDELIREITQTELDIDYNDKDLNYSYYVAKLADGIVEEDWNKLTVLDENTVIGWIAPEDIYDGPHFTHFVSEYYNGILDCNQKSDNPYEIKNLASDYAHMCQKTKRKISLSISSADYMREMCDGYYKEVELAENLEQSLGIPVRVE